MASSCSVQNYKGIYRSHCMCLTFCFCTGTSTHSNSVELCRGRGGRQCGRCGSIAEASDGSAEDTKGIAEASSCSAEDAETMRKAFTVVRTMRKQCGSSGINADLSDLSGKEHEYGAEEFYIKSSEAELMQFMLIVFQMMLSIQHILLNAVEFFLASPPDASIGAGQPLSLRRGEQYHNRKGCL